MSVLRSECRESLFVYRGQVSFQLPTIGGLYRLSCFAGILFISTFLMAIVSDFLGVIAKTGLFKFFHRAVFFLWPPRTHKR